MCIRPGGKDKDAVILESNFNMVKELAHETLEPVGISNQASLHPLLRGLVSCEHSITDPETCGIFNYKLDFRKYATYRIF